MINDFDKRIREILPEGLQGTGIDTLQINIGRHCNLACTHCHLECSPARTEKMPWNIMENVVGLVEQNSFRLVDITGGSPELHPDFIRFVSALRDRGQTVQIRTNLTVLMESSLRDIVHFFKTRKVRLVGSLPCYLEENVDAQRGAEVYKKSIAAIRFLNRAGYGIDAELPLNLTFNPGGPFLPPDESSLEEIYRRELKSRFDISFSRLIILTNMPLGRFRQRLERNGETSHYLSMLKAAFNPATVAGLMCRNQISVDWDGALYDCDFNLALGMGVNHGTPRIIEAFDHAKLKRRQIATGIHCYGCTAGAGSSCSGSITGKESENLEETCSYS